MKIIKETVNEILNAYPDEVEIEKILKNFENKTKEGLIIDILLDKRNKKISEKCWREKGCPFNSNTSSKYMKCWQEDYSVDQCKQDNLEDWG